jgi:hypothetical protein
VKKIKDIFSHIWKEILVLFLFIFLINNFIGKDETTINGDGIGYYDYLPSLFIHSDFIRNNKSVINDSTFYSRINSLNLYSNYKDRKLDKYPCGTALLQSPFFIMSYFNNQKSGKLNDGYQHTYQKTIFYAALFYLFLGVLFTKKLLLRLNIGDSTISFILLTLVLATSLTHYSNIDASYSHIYSFFSISTFLYFSKKYYDTFDFKQFFIACIFLGLIVLIRQINIIIIFALPILAGSWENFKKGIFHLSRHPLKLLSGFLIFISIVLIQSVVWYLQVGDLIVYSYQDEGFNFLNPQFYKILFSYKKGLFVYTPILFLAIISWLILLIKKEFYLVFTWGLFFVFLTYILSSWWCWDYGSSYGLRAYIEFYPIFFILIAYFLNGIKPILRNSIIAISLFTIPLNLIQTYQYKEFILHWVSMDKEKYWRIFLKTDDKFKGYVWKNNLNLKEYRIEKNCRLGKIFLKKHSTKMFELNSNSIKNFKNVSLIEISFENNFKESDSSKILVCINDKNKKSIFWHEINLIQFAEKDFNTSQIGKFDFKFEPIKLENQQILFYFFTQGEPIFLKNIEAKFLSFR